MLRALGLAEEALSGWAPGSTGSWGGTTAATSSWISPTRDLHPEAYGLGIHRGALFELLHGRLQQSTAGLVTGAEIVDVVRDAGARPWSTRRARRHGPFDLVVVADGAHSRLRERLMPRARAPLYPWGCIWATVPDRAGIATAPGLLQQRVRGTTTMMGLLPVGQDLVTLFWSLPVGAAGARQADRHRGLAAAGAWRCGRRRRR